MLKTILLFLFLIFIEVMNAQMIIPLYNDEIPNNKPCDIVENSPAPGRVAGVTKPVLYVYQPAIKDSFKTAVIICPGGGYARLAIDHEGFQVAAALNKKGITAFVLKYRNPIDEPCFENKELVAQQDAQQALLLVRENAVQFDIAADKVGMVGFSAGGHLTATTATHFTTTLINNPNKISLRPDFIILAYPVISFADSLVHKGSRNNMLGINPPADKINLYSNELQVTSTTPPTYIMHAADDKTVKVENSLLFFQALLQQKVAAELTIFQKGGHGFGLINPTEPTNWLINVFGWMISNQFIKGNVSKINNDK